MAAGRGTRLGAGVPKALVPVGHGPDAAPLVTHALRGVLSCPDLSDVVVVAPADHLPEVTSALERTGAGSSVRIAVVAGGAERADSVAAGLRALPADVGVVLVHDAARAFTPPEVFDRVVSAVRHGHPAVIPVIPVTDTIKVVDLRDHVVSTPERSTLRTVQTPQGFLRETLERAHAEAAGAVTDDAGLVEAHGGAVYVVEGDIRSLKVTQPDDLARVADLAGETGARSAPVDAAASDTAASDSRSPATTASGATASGATASGATASDITAPATTATDAATASAPRSGRRSRPVLLSLGGPPGVGKTTLARAWALRHRAVHLRIDSIEQALVRAGVSDLGPEGYVTGYALAADQLRLGLDVVADCVNPLPVTRQAWRDLAARAGARLLEVEVSCAAVEHRARVEGREGDIPGHRVPDWASVQAAEFQPWPEADLRLDTTGRSVEELISQIEATLR